MSGVHRLFGNNLSVIKDAVLTPSSVKTSSNVFVTKTERSGSGTAMLLGNFDGIDDAKYELKVASGEGAGRITHPVFIGVGTGVLSSLEIAGIANQEFTLQLSDLGIDTLNAEVDLGAVVLRALASGVVGNDISLSVDPDELVFTETTFATLEEVTAGATEFVGPQWDWNTAVLNPRGEIPVEGMRLKFENDPQIYRQYKMRIGSDWVYYLSPGAVRAIPAGSKIYEVTGHRRVTITNGVDVEQYTHVKTLYDFVSQVRNDSLLAEVVGVVADDKTPGGMNCQDFPFVTDAYMWPVELEGSKYVQRLDDLELHNVVNNEIIEIECIGTAEMGNEAWSVKGSVTGNLPGVRTAELYVHDPVYFKIPQILIEYQEPLGGIGFEVNYVSRDEGEAEPPICLENRVLGVKAKTGSVTFTWSQNVSLEGCECESASVSGFVSKDCLGLDELNGGGDVIDPEYKTRLNDIYSYIEEYTRDNTYFYGVSGGELLYWRLIKYVRLRAYNNAIDCANDVSWIGEETYSYYSQHSTQAQAEAEALNIPTQFYDFDNYPHAINTCWVGRSNLGSHGLVITADHKAVNQGYTITPQYSGTVEEDEAGGAKVDLQFMHSAVSILLAALVQVYEVPDSLVIWDSLLIEIKNDLNDLRAGSEGGSSELNQLSSYGTEFLERYQSKANLALLAAGIVPGKSHSSGEDAGCWSERSDAFYWRASDGYMPAYNNVVYHSVKRNAGDEVYSTQEFAFVIVCACSQHLKVGDQVIVDIDAQGCQVNTYQLGDKFSIPIIAARDLEFSGGVDGNDTHTWKVDGSAMGQLPDYSSINGAEVLYNQNGLQFLIERGGIPFELGDQWAFSVEGGKFRWKKDNGSWSTDLNIESQVLSDGLSVLFTDGPAPSFKSGDAFEFKAFQPNSAEHVKTPNSERWAWIGDSSVLTVDCGGAVQVSEILLADHNIPNSASVVIQGSQDGFLTVDWSETMVWNEVVLTKVLSAIVSVTHLRINITGAADGHIGWFWAGLGLTTELYPNLSLSRQYAAITGNSPLAGGSIPMGTGWGGTISWQDSMTSTEITALLTLLDYLKENNNEPIIILPHFLHESESRLCRIDTDSVEITDTFNYQPDAKTKRIHSVELSLEPVFL